MQETGLYKARVHYVIFLHISICLLHLEIVPTNDVFIQIFLLLERTSVHASSTTILRLSTLLILSPMRLIALSSFSTSAPYTTQNIPRDTEELVHITEFRRLDYFLQSLDFNGRSDSGDSSCRLNFT